MRETFTGYERKYTSSPNVAPDTGGFKALASAVAWRSKHDQLSYDEAARAMNSLSQTASAYEAKLNEREARDIETEAMNLIRERKLHAFSLEGKEADGLLDSEAEWEQEQLATLAEKSYLSTEMVKQVWDKHSQTYLTQVGAHMLKEGKVAEANSKLGYVLASQDELAISNIGDFRAFAQYSARVKETYGDDEASMAKFTAQGLDVMIDSWAEANPQATINWFNQNKEGLKDVLGRYYSDASQDMTRIENKLLTKARTAEAGQNAALIREERLRRKQNSIAEVAGTQILLDGGSPEDMTKAIVEAGGDATVQLAMEEKFRLYHNNIQRDELAEVAGLQAANTSVLYGQIPNMDSPEKVQLFTSNTMDLVVSGDISGEQARTLTHAAQNSLTAIEGGYAVEYNTAVKTIEAYVDPKNGIQSFFSNSPAKVQHILSYLNTELKRLSPRERMAALDVNDSKSLVSQLIQINRAPDLAAGAKEVQAYNLAGVEFPGSLDVRRDDKGNAVNSGKAAVTQRPKKSVAEALKELQNGK